MYTHSRPTPRATPTYFTPYNTSSNGRPYIPSAGGDRFQSSTVEELVYGTGRINNMEREKDNAPPPSPSIFSTMTQASNASINEVQRREPDDGHGEWVRGKVTNMTRDIMEGVEGYSSIEDEPGDVGVGSLSHSYRGGEASRGLPQGLPPQPPKGSPMMLKKLRVLQSSCLSSLTRLRQIQSSSSGMNGGPYADPGMALEKVVKDQAYRIAALEEKLAKQSEVYGNVLPAQAEYVRELESAVESMESELVSLREANGRDRESFQDMVKVLERERIRADRLEGKCGMLSGYASEVHERIRRGREWMVGIMSQSRNRDLVRRCFEALRGELRGGKEGRVKMERFLAKWTNQGACKCFMAWQRYVAEEKKYRILVGRFLGRINNGVMFKAYGRWAEMVEERKHNRAVIQRFRAKVTNLSVSRSFNTWAAFRLSRKSARSLARRTFSRFVHGVIADAWNVWCLILKEKEMEERRRNALRVVCKVVNKRIAMGWETWKFWVKERRREEGIVRKFGIKMLRRDVRRSLDGWKDFVGLRKRVRRVMRRMIGGVDECLLREGFGIWKESVRERGWTEFQGILEEKSRRIEELEARLEMLENKGKERAMGVAKRMVQQWKSGLLMRVFNGWKDWGRDEREGRVKMERFLKRWRNQSVCRCYVAWQSFVFEAKRYRAVVSRFVGRMKMRFVGMCFDGMIRYVREAKRERRVMDKFRRRWENMNAARGFQGWRGYMVRRKWCRGILLKCLNGKLAGGWVKWVDWLKYVKEEELEGRRRQLVLKKFAKNMNMRGVGKCVRTWKDSVRERKWLRGLIKRCIGGSYFALLGDGFQLWKGNVERIRREEAGMTVEKLKGMVEAMGRELEDLREVKREYACHKVLMRWKGVYRGLVKTAFVLWRDSMDALRKEDEARNIMRLMLLRHIRQQEHRAWRKWMVYAREKTEKLKASCGLVVHSMIRMRNFELHRSFRKWLEVLRKEEGEKRRKLEERKLVVTKASQALKELERGIMEAGMVLGGEDDEDY